MRRLGRRIAGRALCFAGLDRWMSERLADRLFVIGYHSVSSGSPWRHLYAPLSIDRDRFAAQIELLVRCGHSFITLSEIVKPLPPKATVIFFDDGFRDVLSVGLPILEDHGARATLLATTGLIDRTHLLWSIKARHLGLSEAEIRALKRRSPREREAALSGSSIHPREVDIFLDWDDLRSLAKRGFEIGAHGVSHRMLTDCAPNELDAEIADSTARLERELGARPSSFSYPHGRYDGRVMEAVRRAGFRAAVGGKTGLNRRRSLEARRLCLRKIEPSPKDSIDDFAARLYLEGPFR